MTRVLLVDDEMDILDSTAQLLRAFDFDVVTCDQPDEVVGLMRSEHVDIVLHDVRMPGLDLLAQLRGIRADPSVGKVPVILFTATLSAKEMATAVGAEDGIEKPFDPDELADLINKWTRPVHA